MRIQILPCTVVCLKKGKRILNYKLQNFTPLKIHTAITHREIERQLSISESANLFYSVVLSSNTAVLRPFQLNLIHCVTHSPQTLAGLFSSSRANLNTNSSNFTAIFGGKPC